MSDSQKSVVPTVEGFFQIVLSTERLQLVEDLWDTIAAEAPDEAVPLSPELAAELDRRLHEHEANPSAARSWADVRADILKAAIAAPARPISRCPLARPTSFRIVRPGIRRALLGSFPYGVFFADDDKSVTVLAVVHARLHPRRWPSRPAR